MRYMSKTQNVEIEWLHQLFVDDTLAIRYCETSQQAADVFAKAITNGNAWARVCQMINLMIEQPPPLTPRGKSQSPVPEGPETPRRVRRKPDAEVEAETSKQPQHPRRSKSEPPKPADREHVVLKKYYMHIRCAAFC